MAGKINLRKIISIFLSFVMIMACAPTSVIALDSDSLHLTEAINDPIVIDPILSDDVIESVTPEELMNRAPDEKTLIELKEMTVDVSSLPSFIDSGKALQKGHVNRLKSRESNLNTVVYQNNDGTETTYIFMRPVKYIDDNGVVQDKSDKVTSLTDRTYSHGMMNNNVKALFPKSSNYGAKIQYQNYSVQMKPDTTYSSVPSVIDDTTIVYNGVFGENTLLKYQTKLNGVKEDIVLIKNVGQNEFGFTLTLTNLSPTLINDIWYLKNSSNDIVASLGEVIISDSAGNDTKGTMSIESASSKGTFNVKISVPQDFLNSASTVYPVYIDPTVTISEQGTYYGYDDNGFSYVEYYDAIQDTGVYSSSGAAATAIANPNYHKLGYDGVSIGTIIYKLYDFYGEFGQYKTLEAGQINSALMYITVGIGSNTTLTAAPMTSTWNSTTYGENPIAIYDDGLSDNVSTNNTSQLNIDETAGQRAIDITAIVKGWADYNNGESSHAYENPENGFLLSSTLGAIYHSVTAVEESSPNSIYVEMDTSSIGGKYYVNNMLSGQFIRSLGMSVTTSTYATGSSIKWIFEYIGNDRYYIRSALNPNYVLRCIGPNVYLSALPAAPTMEYSWEISSASGGGVIIKSAYNLMALRYDQSAENDDDEYTKPLQLITPVNSSNENYDKMVWGLMRVDNYVNLTSFTVTNAEWLSVGSQQNSQLSIQPTNASWRSKSNFDWKSEDTSVATIDETGRITAVSNGYSKIVVTHKPTGISGSFYVTVGQAITNGNYYFKNKGSGLYLDVEGPSAAENANIQVWSFHTGSQERWQITYSGLGYYFVKSLFSNKYMSVSGGSSVSAAIIQVSTQSEASKWKITKTISDAYKITAQCGEVNNRCLGILSTLASNGTNCSQITYTSDANYQDEWLLYNCDYSFVIKHYYDNGYDVRFGNSYSDIVTYQNICSNILLNIFGINTSVTVQGYTSCSDTCTDTPVTLSDTTTSCSHGLTDHKTRNKLRKDIIDQFGAGTSITTKVSWTGHVLESGSSCTYVNDQIIIMSIGMVTDASHTNLPSSQIRYERIYTLLHESSHALGAPDHYCYDKTSSNCNNPTNDCWRCDRGLSAEPSCLMSYRMNDLESRLNNNNLSNIYCSQCMSSTHAKGIVTHLDDHH